MFIPNEIITEIINIADYLTWIDKIKEVNQQYHSYYEYEYEDTNINYQCIRCIKHGMFVVNWRNNGLYTRHNNKSTEKKIYSICVDSKHHEEKIYTQSQIQLPHNY